jgi:hypothetical protein
MTMTITRVTFASIVAASFVIPVAFGQTPQSVKCDPAQTREQNCFLQEVSPGLHRPGVTWLGGPSEGQQAPALAGIVEGHPYSARAVTEFRQTLENGVHISQRSEASIGRDDKGRTYRTQHLSAIGPWRVEPIGLAENPQAGLSLTVINDPVNNVRIEYTNEGQTASVIRLSQQTPRVPSRAIGASGNAMYSTSANTQRPLPAPTMSQVEIPAQAVSSDARYENLGERTINGVRVVGKRTREIVTANSIGNDREFEIVRETWTSPELGIVVLSTQLDPRLGQTTYALEEISTSAPDGSKFHPPTGYVLKNQALGQSVILP